VGKSSFLPLIPSPTDCSSRRLQFPAKSQPTKPPDPPDRLPDDSPGHLALADIAVYEHDGDFTDPEASAPRARGHLDLEGVSVGLDAVEWNRLEDFPPKTLETAGEVGDGHAGDPSSVDVREVTEHQATDRPVDNGDAPLEVARAENEIVSLNRFQELRQMGRVVGEVGVHFEDEVVSTAESESEACDVCGTEPEFLLAVENPEARFAARDLIREISRSIGRGVIDDEDIEGGVRREDRGDESGEVVPLIIRRDDDESARHASVSGRGPLEFVKTGP